MTHIFRLKKYCINYKNINLECSKLKILDKMEQLIFQALKKMDSYPPSLVKHITEEGHEVWCVFILV